MPLVADIFFSHKSYYSKNCEGEFFCLRTPYKQLYLWSEFLSALRILGGPIRTLQEVNHDLQAESMKTIPNFNQFILLRLLALKALLVTSVLKVCRCFKLANKARILN